MEENPSILSVSWVVQEQDTYCFPACLESILRDWGIISSQKEIIAKCPIQFKKDTDIEGALKPIELDEVAKAFGLNFERITPSTSPLIHPRQGVLIFCFWENRDDQIHWVRFAGNDDKNFYLMNPTEGASFPDIQPSNQFRQWRALWFKIWQEEDSPHPSNLT